MSFDGGYQTKPTSDQSGMPMSTFALLGDSLTEMNGYGLVVTGMTQAGGVASATIVDHGIPSGQVVFVKGAAQPGYNGWKTISSVPDKDTVCFYVPSTTVSPATLAAGQSGFQLRTDARIPGSAWFQFFAGRLKGFPRIVLNAGFGGQTTSEILSRVSEVTASTADTVCVCGGHNDLFWSDSADPMASFANLKAICDAIVSAGKRVVLISCEADSDTSITTVRKKNIQKLNANLLAYAQGKRGVSFVDIYSALVNPTSTTGVAISNAHQSDKVHLAALGADMFGEALYNALKNSIISADAMPSSRIQYGNGQIFSNPLMQGTAGAMSGVTGTVPDNMLALRVGSGTWTASVAARTSGSDGDALGNNVQIATSNAVVNDTLLFSTGDLLSSIAGATKLWSIAHVQIVGAAKLAALRIGLLAKIGTREHWASAMEWWSGMQTGARDMNLVLRSPELIIPAGTTELAWYVQGVAGSTGAITIKVGRLGVFAS